MNLKRFTARTSREALAMVKAAFGDDAVVMSTRPCDEGVEVLAMAPESVEQLERVAAPESRPLAALRAPTSRATLRDKAAPAAPRAPGRPAERTEPVLEAEVEEDIEQMQMSTLSFQDYVRERMLKRRSAERASLDAEPAPTAPALPPVVAPIEAARARHTARREVPVLRDEITPPRVDIAAPRLGTAPATPRAPGEQVEVMTELRSMRGMIEQRFGALAFMEKLQRQPRQAGLALRLLDAGFSPALIRKLVESLPAEGDETSWAAGVLERNVATGELDSPLEDQGGVYALIGATGVGKTTSTAKLAAHFATRHGAPNLGLITLDAYRVGAHEQLRTYGRILGVPVHTAHDRDSLEDLLDLLSAKRMVLIDTAGMAQRDSRTRDLLEMLSHRAINRLLVVSASAQGETIEDQLTAYGAASCRGLILSKLDEAVKLGPALDSMIRHKLKVLAVANGQRVPEDWHRLSAQALVQRALKGGGAPAWQLDERDANLIFAGLPPAPAIAAHV